MHQHIFNARFQGDWGAWAATTCSLHSQFHYSRFSKGRNKKVNANSQLMTKQEQKKATKMVYIVLIYRKKILMQENLRIESLVLNISTIILHCWSNSSFQQLFDHCYSLWIILQCQPSELMTSMGLTDMIKKSII